MVAEAGAQNSHANGHADSDANGEHAVGNGHFSPIGEDADAYAVLDLEAPSSSTQKQVVLEELRLQAEDFKSYGTAYRAA